MKDKDVEKQRKNNGKIPGGVTGKGFKPGQSGNPNGRPPNEKSITNWMRKIGDEDSNVHERTNAEHFARKAWAYALEGNFVWAQMVLDRLEGKAIDRIIQKNDDDELIIL